MKTCPECGWDAQDAQAQCHNAKCGHVYGGISIPTPVPSNVANEVIKRPNGGRLIAYAWVAAGAALVALLFSFTLSTGSYGESSYDDIAMRWWLLVLAGAVGQLALFLGVAGVIVRAIWFLPGADEKQG